MQKPQHARKFAQAHANTDSLRHPHRETETPVNTQRRLLDTFSNMNPLFCVLLLGKNVVCRSAPLGHPEHGLDHLGSNALMTPNTCTEHAVRPDEWSWFLHVARHNRKLVGCSFLSG